MKNLSPSLLVVHDDPEPAHDILSALWGGFQIETCRLEDFSRYVDQGISLIIVDVAFQKSDEALALRAALAQIANRPIARVFILDGRSHLLNVRASAFGADAIITRPFRASEFLSTIRSIYANINPLHAMDVDAMPSTCGPGFQSGVAAIEHILQFASFGVALSQDELQTYSEDIIGSITEAGLADWMQIVLRHHSRTFRHSLLVTGVAVGFGNHLGVRHADLQRLAVGSLMHDIGKAEIPLEILEKPDRLTDSEVEIMRDHAALGRDIMQKSGKFNAELIDIVSHHHELLDGSGYPDKLAGSQISDIVRAVTIADIFSALVEERSYKAKLTPEEACRIMDQMGGKLDQAMLREFAFLTLGAPLARAG